MSIEATPARRAAAWAVTALVAALLSFAAVPNVARATVTVELDGAVVRFTQLSTHEPWTVIQFYGVPTPNATSDTAVEWLLAETEVPAPGGSASVALSNVGFGATSGEYVWVGVDGGAPVFFGRCILFDDYLASGAVRLPGAERVALASAIASEVASRILSVSVTGSVETSGGSAESAVAITSAGSWDATAIDALGVVAVVSLGLVSYAAVDHVRRGRS